MRTSRVCRTRLRNSVTRRESGSYMAISSVTWFGKSNVLIKTKILQTDSEIEQSNRTALESSMFCCDAIGTIRLRSNDMFSAIIE